MKISSQVFYGGSRLVSAIFYFKKVTVVVILKNVNRHMGTAAIFMVNRAKMVLMEK